MKIRIASLCASVLAAAAIACGDGSTDDDIAASGFPLYGPGEHWIDAVRSGTVRFAAVAEVGIDVNGDGSADSVVVVRGSTTVRRSRAAGSAAAPDHRSHLDLEIVDMLLSAPEIAVRAGDGLGNFGADGPLFSVGTSDEAPGDARLAHDRFAIFFELAIGATTLHNRDALTVVATIDRLPPIGNLFIAEGEPVALFTADGAMSAIRIVSLRYTPLDPEAP